MTELHDPSFGRPRETEAASRRRLRVLAGVLAAWALLCAGRAAQVSLARGEEFRARAARQQERRITFQPKRGEVLDAEGRELAISVEAVSVFAVPQEVDGPVATAHELAEALDLPAGPLVTKLRDPRDFVWIARQLDSETAARVRALGLPGVHFLPDSRRVYPKGELASQVVGFCGTDNDGRAGLESGWDAELRGRPGLLTVLRDARRRSGGDIWKEVVRREPTGGRSLRLTLDSSIQFLAERELAAGIAKANATAGSVVVMDPADGAILALASWPPFDPAKARRASAGDWRLRPVMDAYEPGSTFKLVAAASALERGLVSEDVPIDCGGGSITVGPVTIHEHEGKSFGMLPFSEALAVSSNVGIVRVGMLLGRDLFHDRVLAWGFGRPTGIDLPGESPGLLRETRAWSAVSLAAISMGQEIGITPVQLASAYAALANGGILHRPFVVRDVLGAEGAVVTHRSPQAVRRVVDERTARRMAKILEGVVIHGTGKEAAVPGYSVAGKTGTAQKAVRGGYARDRFVASFAGFAPVENPKLLVVVVVDEPKGSIYGGTVAAPIFREIVGPALAYLGVPPDLDRERRVLTARLDTPAPVPPRASFAGLVPVSDAGPRERDRLLRGERVVPDLTGLDLRTAIAILAGRGLVPVVFGSGRVSAQFPPPGVRVSAGAECRIELTRQRDTAALDAPPLPRRSS